MRKVMLARSVERFGVRMRLHWLLQDARMEPFRRGSALFRLAPLLSRLTKHEQLPALADELCGSFARTLRAQRAMIAMLVPSRERGVVNLELVGLFPAAPRAVHSAHAPYVVTSFNALRGMVLEGPQRLGLLSLCVRTNALVLESEAYDSHHFNPTLDRECGWEHTPMATRTLLAVPLQSRRPRNALAMGAIVLINKQGGAGDDAAQFGPDDERDLVAVAELFSLALESCDDILPMLRTYDPEGGV